MAPIEFSVVTPMFGRLVTRALSARALRHQLPHELRLSTLPEPSGAGLLLPAMPALRTHDTWCSAVQPCGAALGSAPRSSSHAASS